MSALTKIFGTHSDRELKRITPLVDKVESYRDEMKALSDEELRGKTKEYKMRAEFLVPRNGTGAMYGESVSRTIFSRGMSSMD